jgi:hypothetical protein
MNDSEPLRVRVVEELMAKGAILTAGAILMALPACATNAPPRPSGPARAPVTAHAPPSVRLAVLPPDALLFSDVAAALNEQLGQARINGEGHAKAMMGNVSMEVAQLSLECVSPTDECYTAVGRFLQVDRLLWGQVTRDQDQAGIKVSIVLLDVSTGTPIARAERTFPEAAAAIRDLPPLVAQATQALARVVVTERSKSERGQ